MKTKKEIENSESIIQQIFSSCIVSIYRCTSIIRLYNMFDAYYKCIFLNKDLEEVDISKKIDDIRMQKKLSNYLYEPSYEYKPDFYETGIASVLNKFQGYKYKNLEKDIVEVKRAITCILSSNYHLDCSSKDYEELIEMIKLVSECEMALTALNYYDDMINIIV